MAGDTPGNAIALPALINSNGCCSQHCRSARRWRECSVAARCPQDANGSRGSTGNSRRMRPRGTAFRSAAPRQSQPPHAPTQQRRQRRAPCRLRWRAPPLTSTRVADCSRCHPRRAFTALARMWGAQRVVPERQAGGREGPAGSCAAAGTTAGGRRGCSAGALSQVSYAPCTAIDTLHAFQDVLCLLVHAARSDAVGKGTRPWDVCMLVA